MVAAAAPAAQWTAALRYFGALAHPGDPDRARIRWLRGRMVQMPLGEHLALVVVPNMAWGMEAARLLVEECEQHSGPVLLLSVHRQAWFFTTAPRPGTTWALPGAPGPVLHTSGTAAMPPPTRDGKTWMWLNAPRAGVLTPPALVQAALTVAHGALRRNGLV
ncbi:hypothetical protein [Kitasatospora sp. NPDC088134]|uniref:hypothetical protein n=1 Tax=Kitasatospora sp. NPDC088134 TaxID=3364071 RepID=UPI00382775D7